MHTRHVLRDCDLTPDCFLISYEAMMKATDNSPNRSEVAAFVQKNFAPQDELENATLPDWTENPAFFSLINDPEFRDLANRLNDIWKSLARTIKKDVMVNPQRHSLIYVNNTFIIPGGRFKGIVISVYVLRANTREFFLFNLKVSVISSDKCA